MLDAGVPQASIDQMRECECADLFFWLYEDIRKDEAGLINGERHSVIAGVFVTDGRLLLLERNPQLGNERPFSMGGQVPLHEDVRVAAAREVCEETGFACTPEQLELLEVVSTSTSGSKKLPNVPSPRTIHHFMHRVLSFEGVTPGIRESKDEKHELLLLTIEEALTDERVEKNYRAALGAHLARIEGKP